jgi:hypothetical protein
VFVISETCFLLSEDPWSAPHDYPINLESAAHHVANNGPHEIIMVVVGGSYFSDYAFLVFRLCVEYFGTQTC